MLERFIKFFKKEMNKLTQQNNTNIECLTLVLTLMVQL